MKGRGSQKITKSKEEDSKKDKKGDEEKTKEGEEERQVR
jgi:hypothetical protein